MENMNKLVKHVLNSVLAKRRLSGENPNWTTVLGSVATAINSQHGHGSNKISTYETIFGQSLHHQYSCSREEAQRCWTVDAVLLVTNDETFHENVVMDYDLRVDRTTDSDSVFFWRMTFPLTRKKKYWMIASILILWMTLMMMSTHHSAMT